MKTVKILDGNAKDLGIVSNVKFGYNPLLPNGSEEPIWVLSTAHAFPTTAGTVSVVSSSIEDAEEGDGIQTLWIQGLDSTGKIIKEMLPMDGTTPVVTTKEFFRVGRMYGENVGVTKTNEGNITATLDSKTVAYILAGEGQTLQAIWTIPKYDEDGSEFRKAHLHQIYASMAAGNVGNAVVRLKVAENFSEKCLRTRRIFAISNDMEVNRKYGKNAPFVLNVLDDIVFTGEGDANNIGVDVEFCVEMIK